jgi:mercuric ion binding protein
MKTVFALTALSVLSLSALAAPTTVILSVPSMDCPVCPITVKAALTKVKGVSQATKDAGYPSVITTAAK